MPLLRIIDGPDKGREFALGERTTLGRSRECDVRIKDAESSRFHAEAVLRDGCYRLRDLDSSNGTFLNDMEVVEEVLRNGDRIRIGVVTLEFVEEGAGEASEVSGDAVSDATSETAHGEGPVPATAELEGQVELEPVEPVEPEAGVEAEKQPVQEPAADVEAKEQPVQEPEADVEAKEQPVQEPEPDVEAKEQPVQKPEAGDGLPSLLGYRLIEPLYHDDRSAVYRAVELSMDRPVAVEFLTDASCRDPEAALEQIRSAAQLDHPALVHIYSAVRQDGGVYLARELAEGQSMWALNGQLSPAEVLDVAIEAAGALEEAHERGVAHGAIRPDRIVRTARGRIKVVGLGLPAPHLGRLSDGAELQRPNRIGYLAPEQFAGVRPSAAGDVYSLGAVLYHALCGQPPFAGASEVAVAAKITSEDIVPVLRLKPQTPRALANVIEKMLSRSRTDRFGSMAEVREKLEAIGRKVTVAAGAGEVVPERRGVAASSIVIVILTLLLLAAVALLGKFAGVWFLRKGAEGAPRIGSVREQEHVSRVTSHSSPVGDSTPITWIPAA